MQKKMKNKGITLVALVITIIVLLILAGVTVGMVLSDNGIFTMAKKATESYNIASEREYIEQNVLSVQLDRYTGNASTEKLGEILYDKNLNNGDKWHIVATDEKVYGTNWNYIKKGTELQNYGKAQNGWLINYQTGEIVELEENYNSITVEDTIAIRDNLIINIDSAMLDNDVQNTKESIEATLGEGVELHNFDFKNDGLINKEFVFDGENDFILIDYNKISSKDEKLLENGLTFEFYGKIEKGKQLLYKENVLGKEITSGITSSAGIFQITEKNDIYYTQNQFSRVIAFFTNIVGNKKDLLALYFGGRSGDDDFDRYSGGVRNNWVKEYKIENENDEYSYYTVSIRKNEDGKFTQSFFENGKLIKTGELNEICINGLSNLEKNFLAIGVAEEGYADETGNNIGKACLSKINAKCLRLYNRGLTNEEVLQNYEKTTSYHNLMEKVN